MGVWLNFSAAVGALVVVSLLHDMDRGYVFEIIVIMIVWMTLIVAGPLVAAVPRRALSTPDMPEARLRAHNRAAFRKMNHMRDIGRCRRIPGSITARGSSSGTA